MNQTLVMDLGISFSSTGMITDHHIGIWGAREGASSHGFSSFSLSVVGGSAPEVGSFLDLRSTAPHRLLIAPRQGSRCLSGLSHRPLWQDSQTLVHIASPRELVKWQIISPHPGSSDSVGLRICI